MGVSRIFTEKVGIWVSKAFTIFKRANEEYLKTIEIIKFIKHEKLI